MSIKAGDLRHEITLLKPTRGTNERGRSVVSWTEVGPIMAGLADVSGREFWEAQAYHAEKTRTFTIRYREDVDETWRVKHRGSVYNIQEVNHLGYMRDYIRLKCQNVEGGGA